MKILVTGFDPFGGEKVNPALEAVKSLPSEIHGAEVHWVAIPTVFYQSAEVLEAEINRYHPDAVLCIGQAGGRASLTPERVAINQDDARIPDNQGNQPIDEPIFPNGENAYFSTLPVKAMVEAIRKEGLPSSLSNSAGTYVCNHLMYGVLYYLDKRPVIKAGFIHVPYIPEQTKNKKEMPALELSEIVRGLEASITAIAINGTDKKLAYGQND